MWMSVVFTYVTPLYFSILHSSTLLIVVRLHAGVVETAEAFYAAKHKQEPM